MVAVWGGGTQEITVAAGLVTAGIALQDVIKNLAGGIIIYLNRLYVVGDRIEINSKTGTSSKNNGKQENSKKSLN